ncbi:NADH-quinone oxidoreductase subunit NuoE [Paenibacillus sp. DXFW5]|uniref:NADH-quinone oxidoreductase subunit NuoE n=2 Tax=Paenibacillus TaxID=44249 RepID=A0ABS2HE15_9BACL|nr:NADH-quinone oxidoreductase subunit NuoE [Paenibacillus rhizolycopersici]
MKGEDANMEETCHCEGEQERLRRVGEIVDQFRLLPGALIPVLHEIQDLYGYLPEEALQIVSRELGMPMAEIYGVATFYSFFSLEPKGEHVIRVCMGTACYIKGAQGVLDRLSQELNVPVQGTTADGKFTLDATRCLGACGLAPVMTIGEKVHGRLTPNEIPKILKPMRTPAETH